MIPSRSGDMSARTAGRIAANLLAVLATAACRDHEPPPLPAASATVVAGPMGSAAGSGLPSTRAAAAADGGEAEPAGPTGKVLCFGDSITQADWPGKIAPEEKWVTRLGTKSKSITAVNAGRNGRTTAEGVTELPEALDEHADAAYVLFFLGVNDVKHARPGTVERATANMSKMIDLTRQRLPKTKIVLMAPVDVTVDKLTPYFRDEAGMGADTPHFMSAMRAAYKTLADKKGVHFVDLLHAVTPALIEDGVHPNGKGQVQIAEAVWNGLVAISALR
jgi:lysophospholipase L1-like esterase